MGIFAQDETVIVTPLRTSPSSGPGHDVSFNYEKAGEMPAFMPRPREADGTYRMAQVDVERSQEFRKCISASSVRTPAM
jgi:succinate dehydrogenase / fumarate reductase iron-sulfur subunit